MLIHLYRVKHRPTGLYYTPGAWSQLTEKGKIYSGGNNIINFMNGGCKCRWLDVGNQKTIKKYREVLEKCGEFKKVFVGGAWVDGYRINAHVDDFEIESLTFVQK